MAAKASGHSGPSPWQLSRAPPPDRSPRGHRRARASGDAGWVSADRPSPRSAAHAHAHPERPHAGARNSSTMPHRSRAINVAMSGPFGRQHLAHFGTVGDAVDAADQRIADDVGPQRVAFGLAAGFGQQRADVGIELAQCPIRRSSRSPCQAFGRDLDFHLAVLDQAQRVPARGAGRRRAGGGRRRQARHQFAHTRSSNASLNVARTAPTCG